jgi:MFS family permease
VLINFATQLLVDLIFSLFSHKFNISKTVKFTPVLTFIGLLVFSTFPLLFADYAYLGLALGTVIFSASSGLVEVLLSPVIAAIPSDNPDREMSKLHSVYAWGVVPITIISTFFLYFFEGKSWSILIWIFSSLPLLASILFSVSKVPEIKTPGKMSASLALFKNKTLWLFIFMIFLGGATECTMAQWASSYLEASLAVPKIFGDIFGVALFAVMLGIGRTLYAKIGKNIHRVLILGSIGSAICYLVAALTPLNSLGIVACAMTGFCASMLWPGSIIVSSSRFADTGVFIFAIMAAGGDLGASFGPQIVGVLTDIASRNRAVISLADKLTLSPEQLSMKIGMLFGVIFPLILIPIHIKLSKSKKQTH